MDEADILDKYDETLKVILDIDEVMQNMPHEIVDNAAAKDRIEVSVSFVSEDSIKQLNLDYRGFELSTKGPPLVEVRAWPNFLASAAQVSASACKPSMLSPSYGVL